MQGSKLNVSKNSSIVKWLLLNKQTQKSHFEGSIFHVALHNVLGEVDEMIMTLSFANLVCSLSCRLKDHKNSRRSENEETDESRNNSLQSC